MSVKDYGEICGVLVGVKFADFTLTSTCQKNTKDHRLGDKCYIQTEFEFVPL